MNLAKASILCLITLFLISTGISQNTPSYLAEIDVQYDYSSVILSDSTSTDVRFTINNSNPDRKDINITFNGVNANFSDGSQYKAFSLMPGEVRSFVVNINPFEGNTGERNLEIVVNYDDIMFNQTETIPVLVRDIPTIGRSTEVPGISSVNLFMLVLMAAYLYFVQL